MRTKVIHTPKTAQISLPLPVGYWQTRHSTDDRYGSLWRPITTGANAPFFRQWRPTGTRIYFKTRAAASILTICSLWSNLTSWTSLSNPLINATFAA